MNAGDDPTAANDSVFTSLFIVIGLLFTAAVAIMLGLSDGERVRVAPAIGVTPAGQLAAVTLPLPTAELPAPTATATPTSTPQPTPTPISRAAETIAPTAVAVLAEVPCTNAPAGWLLYTVQDGDDLLTLSAESGATPSEISQANCLELGILLAGDEIFLPPAPPQRPVCGPPHWWVRYMVSRGDTLYSLAWRHGTTVFAIMQANCLEATRIFAGRSLFLPPILTLPTATATPTTSPTPSPTATPTRIPSSTPLPTATTASPTPVTTATATPTATTSPTTTPSPTATPTPSATPPAGTPTGTSTPTASPTPLPSNTPTVTATQSPTTTATIASAPTATTTSTPTGTPTPAATATPTTASTLGFRSRK